MIAHVVSNFFCNYNCEYCYLGNLKENKNIINTKALKKNFLELSSRYGSLERIDIYGGEITLLPIDTAIELIEICKSFAPTTFVTNLSNPDISDEIVKRTGIKYAISVNDERPYNDTILERSFLTKYHPNSIIQVATPSLLAKSAKQILKEASLFNTEFVGFTQYFPSEKNNCNYQSKTPNSDYANFLIRVLDEYLKGDYKFSIENLLDLELVFNDKYTPWMQEAIFIMPHNGSLNNYACILYNRKGIERFHILNDLDEFDKLAHFEFYEAHTTHSKCKYFGHCYAEHLRPWNEEIDGCPGLFRVLEWYKNEKQNREKNLCKTN